MKEINIKDIAKYKILPFNVYNELGTVIAYAGDFLTAGKVAEIKDMPIFLYDEDYKKNREKLKNNPLVRRRLAEKKRIVEEKRLLRQKEKEQEQEPTVEVETEVFEMGMPTEKYSGPKSFNTIDISKYSATINSYSDISKDMQLRLKYFYSEILILLEDDEYDEALNKLYELSDKILTQIIDKNEDIKYLSKLKLIGEYKKCHSLNVAILSGIIAQKIELSNNQIQQMILAGLVHDIGCTKMDQEFAYKKALTPTQKETYTLHTKLGYDIIKNKLKLDNKIALCALNHHELCDGSGYPKGMSFDDIPLESHILIVCNFYDNLTFNRTSYSVYNSRDAVKALLDLGSSKFSPQILYTLTNKFAFNDSVNFADMIK